MGLPVDEWENIGVGIPPDGPLKPMILHFKNKDLNSLRAKNPISNAAKAT